MSIIIMILLLSLLILVHEAGHFIAARAFGIKVEKFGFGLPIGPTLFRTKCGETEILVHAFLLGGYISFPDDEKESDIPEDSPERFANKPIWQRAVVVSAGVIANVICALALVMFVAGWTKQLPSGEYEIYTGSISAPQDASIWKSGLQVGDRILSVNGCKTENIYSLVTIVKNSAKGNGVISQETIDKNYTTLKVFPSTSFFSDLRFSSSFTPSFLKYFAPLAAYLSIVITSASGCNGSLMDKSCGIISSFSKAGFKAFNVV